MAVSEEVKGGDGHHGVPWHRREGLKPAYSHSFWWFLFANGGALAAILLPVHILVQGILGPLGVPEWMYDRDRFSWVLGNPLVKLYLIVLTFLIFIHAAHRTRFLLIDLGIRGGVRPIQYLMYGAAIAGTLVGAYLLIVAP